MSVSWKKRRVGLIVNFHDVQLNQESNGVKRAAMANKERVPDVNDAITLSGKDIEEHHGI